MMDADLDDMRVRLKSYNFSPVNFGFVVTDGFELQKGYMFCRRGSNCDYFLTRGLDSRWQIDYRPKDQHWQYGEKETYLIPDEQTFLDLMHRLKATEPIAIYRNYKLANILE